MEIEDFVMSITLSAMLAQTADVCGGHMRIDGTRITVHRIATLYKQGQGPEEILQTYPQLSLAQVYSALAYYHANRAEVESELAAADHLLHLSAQFGRCSGESATGGEFFQIAPWRDGNFPKPVELLEVGHEAVDRLAAAEFDQLELARQLQKVRHKELGEHLRR